MNFFGHATIARTEGSLRGEPGYVLGSMLPDFASMAKLRLAGVDDPVIEAGVGLHHRTDVAFHGAPTFVRLMHAAQDELEDEGLGHGSAMAVAHVGVELLLDGCLADQLGVDESYRQALATENAAINWRQADGTSRWEYMRARIAEAPFPEGYKDPDFVATRLIRILAARPRLAIHGPGEPTVHAWAKRARPEVEANAATLLDEVCNRLRAADVGS